MPVPSTKSDLVRLDVKEEFKKKTLHNSDQQFINREFEIIFQPCKCYERNTIIIIN